MRRVPRWALQGAGVVLLAACASGAPAPRGAGHRLTAWLECVECTDGELDSLAPHAGTLGDTLHAILRDGAPPARQELLRRRLGAIRRRLEQQHAGTPALPQLPDSAAYTGFYLSHLHERFCQRAALALAAHGGVPGRAALEGAVIDSGRYRVFTRIVIREARDSARVRFP